MYKLLVLFMLIQLGTTQLLDQAKSELDELDSLVTSKINVAHDNLDISATQLSAYSDDVIIDGNSAIESVYTSVLAQLDQIKQLAGDMDISRCTAGREQMLNQLPNELRQRLFDCVTSNNEIASSFVDDSKYIVDIVINDVRSLDFQLEQCDDTILCISPLLTKIQEGKISLPQRIDVEVTSTLGKIDDLTALVSDCHTTHVADFTGYVTELVQGIGDCVSKLPCTVRC